MDQKMPDGRVIYETPKRGKYLGGDDIFRDKIIIVEGYQCCSRCGESVLCYIFRFEDPKVEDLFVEYHPMTYGLKKTGFRFIS